MATLQNTEKTISQGEIRNVFLLLGVPLFANLNAEILVPVAEIAQELSFATGDEIYREGQASQELFVIVDGEVSIRQSGREIGVLGRRESFGELALLDRAQHLHTAVSSAPTTVISIDGKSFEHLLNVYPQLGRAVAQELTRRLRVVEGGS